MVEVGERRVHIRTSRATDKYAGIYQVPDNGGAGRSGGAFPARAPRTCMAEREYVYTTHATEADGRKLESIESVINEHAQEGWRFVDTLENGGTTIGLVFEQER